MHHPTKKPKNQKTKTQKTKTLKTLKNLKNKKPLKNSNVPPQIYGIDYCCQPPSAQYRDQQATQP